MSRLIRRPGVKAARFSNDRHRPSRRPVPSVVTTVREGASLGAAAVIGPGVTIGRYAMVGMGGVVTRDVPDHALVYGNPLRSGPVACAFAAAR